MSSGTSWVCLQRDTKSFIPAAQSRIPVRVYFLKLNIFLHIYVLKYRSAKCWYAPANPSVDDRSERKSPSFSRVCHWLNDAMKYNASILSHLFSSCLAPTLQISSSTSRCAARPCSTPSIWSSPVSASPTLASWSSTCPRTLARRLPFALASSCRRPCSSCSSPKSFRRPRWRCHSSGSTSSSRCYWSDWVSSSRLSFWTYIIASRVRIRW